MLEEYFMKVLKIANSARTTGEPNSPSIEKCANIYATGSGKGKRNEVLCKWDKSWITHAPVILWQRKSKFSGFSLHQVSSIVGQLLS